MNEIKTSYNREGDAAYIRRSVRSMCSFLGFKEKPINEINLIITELLSNITKHGGHTGVFKANPIYHYDKCKGIKIRVQDFGPGIDNIEKAIEDGYSTFGSMGLGLGAVKRLSDWFNIQSYPFSKYGDTSGTIIEVVKLLSPSSINYKKTYIDYTGRNQNVNHWKWFVDGKTIKRDGSRYNGDGLFWRNNEDTLFAAIIDGIGHGLDAHEAAIQAISTIRNSKQSNIHNLIEMLHQNLVNTVGCQLFLIKINKLTGSAEYIGIGNIRAFLITQKSTKSLTTKDGTIGRILPSLNIEKIEISYPSMFILHTDGVSRVWLSQIKHKRSQYNLGNHILGDFNQGKYRKKNDDSSYVVIKNY